MFKYVLYLVVFTRMIFNFLGNQDLFPIETRNPLAIHV